MESVRSYLRIAGYVTTVSVHGVVLATILASAGQPSADERVLVFQSNRNRYLTGWNVFLQSMHAFLGLWCEYLLLKNSSNRRYALPKYLKGVRDKLFTNIVFPGSFVVATVFWVLFTYDRELVYPAFIDQIIPLTGNHVLHTAIVPLALYELLVQPRREPASHAWNCIHIALHCALYAAVVFYTYYEKGEWLYPILSRLSPPLFVAFAAVVVSLAYVFYFMQWRLVRLLHGATGDRAPPARGGKKKMR